MEDVVARGISMSESPHKIITRVLLVVVVEPTISGALEGIKADIKVQAAITFVTINKPTVEFKWWWLICFPMWTCVRLLHTAPQRCQPDRLVTPDFLLDSS